MADYNANTVNVFGQLVIVPDPSIGSVINTGQTFGTLTGHVDPADGRDVTGCHFEYGSEEGNYSLGKVPCEPATPYAGETEVNAKISGLLPETTYHYRLVVANSNGANVTSDHTYTPHWVIGLSTAASTNIASTSVQLNGSFIGNGEDTHYYFEWGPSASYGNKVPVPSSDDGAPNGPSPTQLSYVLSGLNPASTYHYRVVATNSGGTSYGEDEIVSTPLSAPLASESVSNVSSDSALLNAQINPGGNETTYRFEYATEAEFQSAGMTYSGSAPLSGGKLASGDTFLKYV